MTANMFFFRLNAQYSSFNDKFTSPKNTNELILLVDFIDHIKYNVLPGMTNTAAEVFLCQYFLIDFVEYTVEEREQNATTFFWVKCINEHISKSPKTINDKIKEFKELLMDRKHKLSTDLSNYLSEVDGFKRFDDINDINMYVKKSQNMYDKLTEALQRIDEINKEEKYFGIKESTYPFRKIVNIIIY